MYRSALRSGDFHPETRAFFKDRRVAVFGGSGFIGSHVVEQLIELGATPIVLSRQERPAFLEGVCNAVKLVNGDLNNYAAALSVVRDASVVLNLAAAVAGIEWNAKHPASMFMNNMDLFFNAVRASQEAGVARFLVTSSACVYPRHCSVPTPEAEGFVDQPEPTNAGYGWAKRMEEFLGQSAIAEYGLSVAIARPYNAYGPRDDFDSATSHVLPALIRKAVETTNGQFSVWGDGSHSRSFLYVDDFARGLLETAARAPAGVAINLGSAEEITIREAATLVAEVVSDITGRQVDPVFDPEGLTGQPRRACDTRLAEELIGYQARVGFADGIRRTIEWYLE
jgi:GDP-L-fucose synthase